MQGITRGWLLVGLVGLVVGLGGVATLVGGQLLAAPASVLIAKLPGVACILGTALMFACGAVLTKKRPLGLPLTAPCPAAAGFAAQCRSRECACCRRTRHSAAGASCARGHPQPLRPH